MAKVFKRRIIREKVLQLLYAYEMNNSTDESLSNKLLTDIDDQSDREFAHNLMKQVISNQSEFDELIKEKVSNWDLGRIALIDLILLRMGICEIIYFTDIPPKVSINEVIEIAKIYSTASSGKFINGILDSILAELKKNKKLDKKGRGLLEQSLAKSSKK